MIDRPWDALTLQCTSSQRTESLQRSIKSLQQNDVVVGEMDQRRESHGFKVPVGAHCSLLTHDGLHGSANMSPQTLTPSATSRLPVAPRLSNLLLTQLGNELVSRRRPLCFLVGCEEAKSVVDICLPYLNNSALCTGRL